MNTHITRFKKLNTKIGDTKYSFSAQAANIAMDCAINQLHGVEEAVDLFGGITLKSFREMLEDDTIEANQHFEYYFNKMHENAEKLIQKYGESMEGVSNQDNHEMWEEGGEGGQMEEAIAKNAVKKAAEATGRGNIPGDLLLMIDELLTSKVNWKQKLRQFIQARVRANKKATRSKRNRRYGIVFPGKKKDYVAHIAVAVDTSGSMSDQDLARCFTEIHKIATTTNVRLTVIEADAQVTQVYPFDVKTPPSPKGRGGTAYQPAFDKATELDVDGVLYMGDFDAFDTPKKPKYPVLWVGIGCNPGRQTPGDFGSVVYIDTKDGVESAA